MNSLKNKSSASSGSLPQNISHKHHTNWHEAAACAVQIELRDYKHLLQFQTEYVLGKNSFRIDLLIIKKLYTQPIQKNIASLFKTFNLFEIKGIHSCINTDCYYKTIGYAGLFIDQTGETNQYINTDISLSFLCFHHPRALIKHLRTVRKLTVAKFSSGVYYVINEIFSTQIIVTSELSPDDNLYLRCLTNELKDTVLLNRLIDDYRFHQEQDIYLKYMHQLSNANIRTKGANIMAVCEGILNLCGTSSEEIIERTKKEEAEFYLPQINALTDENEKKTSFINELSSQVDYLKNLLIQNNIPFKLEP